MTAPIRIGLLGSGRIGAMHAELLARRIAGVELVAVCDTNEHAARPVAKALGVPHEPTVDGVLERVDAVAICTSTDSHVDLLVRSAEAGRAVFLEKPVSLDLAETDRGLAAVERNRTFLQVGFNRRFDPAHRSVRDAVAAGALGDLHLVRITSRDPAPPPLAYARVSGGIFLDMTIHDFDMARFVTDSEVVEVFARGSIRITPELAELGDLDTVVVTLVHENGVLTTIDNSRQAVYGYDQRVEAFGSKGSAASENLPAHGSVLRTEQGSATPPLRHLLLERYAESYVAQWEAFVAAYLAGDPPPVTGVDGRAPLAIGLAAWRSAREGRPVPVAEVG